MVVVAVAVVPVLVLEATNRKALQRHSDLRPMSIQYTLPAYTVLGNR